MNEIIGQRGAETLLARSIQCGRICHAYLFLGASGSGKATVARRFAMALECERQPAVAGVGGEGSGDEGRLCLAPCGSCESCRRIAADTHPEVIEVRPGSKTGQNISVDQAREIRRNAALRPKLGRRRIYILPQAEALGEEAANALLKTLEEPSEFITLILCAPNPSQVLPTIRSRCQIVRFGFASPRDVAAALEARGTASDLAAALARACGGRPGRAISWAQEPVVLEQRQRILELFARAVRAQAEVKRQPGIAVLSLRLAEQLKGVVSSERDDDDGPVRPAKVLHSENLEVGLSYLRDLLLLAEGADASLAHNQDRVSELRELTAGTTPERALRDVCAVRETQQLLDRNVAPQLVLERMFWALISGSLPIEPRLFEEALV